MNEAPNVNDQGGSGKASGSLFAGVVWWTMLLSAVIAIPSAAIIIAVILPIGEAGRVFSFIIACWACTWIGMWLMNRAK